MVGADTRGSAAADPTVKNGGVTLEELQCVLEAAESGFVSAETVRAVAGLSADCETPTSETDIRWFVAGFDAGRAIGLEGAALNSRTDVRVEMSFPAGPDCQDFLTRCIALAVEADGAFMIGDRR